MSERPAAPQDPLTGVPLPIVCGDVILNNPRAVSEHHAYFPHPELKRPLGRRALRACRIQKVHPQLHNQGETGFHKQFGSPYIPDDPHQQLSEIILACAGFMPQEVVVINRGGSTISRPNTEQQRYLKEMKGLDYAHFRYKIPLIRKFFREYFFSQELDFSDIRQETLEEFLCSPDLNRRRQLGYFVLAKVIEAATEHVTGKYNLVRKKNLLLPDAPYTPRDVVKQIVCCKTSEPLSLDDAIVIATKLGLVA